MSEGKKTTDPKKGKSAGSPCDGGKLPCKKDCKPITKIEIVSITFKSDHNLLKKYDTDWNDGGSRYPKPEWTPGDQHPVSHNMDKKVKLEIKIKVSPKNACPETGNLEGKAPDGLVFKKNNVMFSEGERTFTLESDKKIKKEVRTLDFKIDWKTTSTSVKISPSQTTNKMYITYDTPYSSTGLDNAVTKKRLEWVCNKCSGDKNGHASVKKIHDSTSTFDLSASVATNHWEIAGGRSAQCMDLSKFYMLATEMLGLRTGKVVYLYPKAGKTAKESTSSGDVETRPVATSTPAHAASTTHNDVNPNEEILLVDFSGGWNNFEACYKFTHPDSGGTMKTTYYAGGAGIYDTKQKVMEAVCDKTHWTYEAGGGAWSICATPGPSPVDDW